MPEQTTVSDYDNKNYKLMRMPAAVLSLKPPKYIPDSYSSNEKVGLGLGCLTSSSSRISSMSSSSGSEVISNMVFINKFYHMSTINSESTNILKDFMRAFKVSPHCYFIRLNPRKKGHFQILPSSIARNS